MATGGADRRDCCCAECPSVHSLAPIQRFGSTFFGVINFGEKPVMSPLAQSKRTSTTPRGVPWRSSPYDANFFAGCATVDQKFGDQEWYQKSKSVSAKRSSHLDDCIQAYGRMQKYLAEKDVLKTFQDAGEHSEIAVLGVLHKSGIASTAAPPTATPKQPKKHPCSRRRSPRSRTIRGSLRWPLDAYIVSSEFGERWGKLHKGMDMAATSASPCMPSRTATSSMPATACAATQRDHFAPRSQDQLALRPQQRTQGETGRSRDSGYADCAARQHWHSRAPRALRNSRRRYRGQSSRRFAEAQSRRCFAAACARRDRGQLAAFHPAVAP